MKKNTAEFIYGIHAVESMLRNNCEDVLQVWVAQGRKDKRVQEITDIAGKAGISVEAISADKMNNKMPRRKASGHYCKNTADKKQIGRTGRCTEQAVTVIADS